MGVNVAREEYRCGRTLDECLVLIGEERSQTEGLRVELHLNGTTIGADALNDHGSRFGLGLSVLRSVLGNGRPCRSTGEALIADILTVGHGNADRWTESIRWISELARIKANHGRIQGELARGARCTTVTNRWRVPVSSARRRASLDEENLQGMEVHDYENPEWLGVTDSEESCNSNHVRDRGVPRHRSSAMLREHLRCFDPHRSMPQYRFALG